MIAAFGGFEGALSRPHHHFAGQPWEPAGRFSCLSCFRPFNLVLSLFLSYCIILITQMQSSLSAVQCGCCSKASMVQKEIQDCTFHSWREVEPVYWLGFFFGGLSRLLKSMASMMSAYESEWWQQFLVLKLGSSWQSLQAWLCLFDSYLCFNSRSCSADLCQCDLRVNEMVMSCNV